MAEDRVEIETAVRTYLDGLHEGDADKLASVFHPTSNLTYEEGGALKPLPRDEWLATVARGRRRSRAGSHGTTRSSRSTSRRPRQRS